MVLHGVPDYGLATGWSGTVHVVEGELDPVPPLVQGPPYPAQQGSALLDDLKQRYCSWNLPDTLGSVGERGPVLSAVFADPAASRTCPSLPHTAVSPALPDSKTGQVGYAEVALSSLDPASADAQVLSQRLAARQPGTDTWRGFSVSSPFLPGGESLMASLSSSCMAAAAAASSGGWLALLEQHLGAGGGADSGLLPAVAPPGLSRGMFGAWNMPEDLRPSEEELLAALPTTAAAAPLQQQPASSGASTTAGPLLGAAATAPLPPAAAAAAAAAAADANPGGIFDGLWRLQQEAGQIESSESEQEEDEAEEEPGAAEQTAAAAAADASSALEQAAEAAAAVPEGMTADGAIDAAPAADSVDSLLAADGVVQAAGRAAAAAAAAANAKPPRARGAASDTDFAVRGGISDLAGAWAALKPSLALSFPFELDTFQKEAVLHLEAGRSVFVAAHTSAGKTVVAEYAFALAGAHASRAVYTSPIKTISNQKFRDFSAKFEVGLLTGDVQINPQAPCLIMTTEVLRSMLYKGADVIRDIEFVVFDEVHYVNDAERGVVWEEVIIMLPPHITIVMLSATVPNVMEFASWVGRTKNRVIYVTGTNKRPVPLEHNVYYAGEIYQVMSGDSTFNADSIRRAAAAHRKKTNPDAAKSAGAAGGGGRGGAAARPTGRGQAQGPNRGGGGGGGGGRGYGGRGGGADGFRRQLQGGGGGGGGSSDRAQLQDLIQLLRKRDLLPVAFFTFSKKRCDAAADACSALDLTTSAEKHTVHVFVQQVLSRLREGDRELPQIMRLRDLMRRGVAVHHAGLLPIMKETVEMLFCQGYIKVLFCTETFAMGVNAPTRTVVFHGLRKHDGRSFRTLLPGEYTQMAGRAGRRGLDAVGMVVIAAWEEPPGEGDLKQLLLGKGVSLSSQFRLTYSMMLNLLRVEDLKVEDMLRRSFAEFHAQRAQPGKSAALAAGQAQLAAYQGSRWPGCLKGCSRGELQQYVDLGQRIDDISSQLQEAVLGSRSIHSLLQPGRAVLLQQPASGLTELAVVVGSPDTLDQLLAAADSARGGFGGPKKGGFGSGSGLGSGGAGGGGVGPERVMWFLGLHQPGPLDEPAADDSAASAAAAAVIEEEFQGFKLKGGSRAAANIPGPLPRYGSSAGLQYMLLAAPAKQIVGICRAKPLKVEPLEVLEEGGKGIGPALRQLQKMREEAAATGLGDPEQLDLRQEAKINSLELAVLFSERTALLSARAAMPVHTCPGTPEQAALVRSELLLTRRLKELSHELSDASLQQMPEFHQRVGVLQQLGYVSPDGTVTLKGRAACEINSTQDELLSTELLFRGLLSGLSPEEAVALMSALVFQEKSDVEPELPPALASARGQLVGLAGELARLQAAAGLPIAEEEYLREVLHPGLMQVVYEWARGTPFSAITPLTDVMEGSIVRAVVRLDQCCRELMDAARVMGDTGLFSLMEAASGKIRRDIVFAASLYVA
ncbi:hypothetical protein OEZ86_000313 [Tetradesmus obliquus]|nr:hypothetical protein OEZ86_000313 [Tetradesmus obliquus]